MKQPARDSFVLLQIKSIVVILCDGVFAKKVRSQTRMPPYRRSLKEENAIKLNFRQQEVSKGSPIAAIS